MSPTKYVVIIDAGSTGSRVHVHPYREARPLPAVLPSESTKIKPGLSSYGDEPGQAAVPVQALVDFAMARVPAEQHRSTPVYLRATAGLRTLLVPQQEAILAACRAVLERSPFRFRPEWASVISGADEGIYGWLTVNYLEGTLHDAGAETVGVLEMGGASVQITFVPGDEDAREHPGTVTVRLGPDRSYPVYTHSYLEYGLDEAMRLFDRLNAEHLHRDGSHPCYPRDFRGEGPGQGLGLTGSGEQARCARMMDAMFRKPPRCADRERHDDAFHRAQHPPKCAGGFNGVWQPRMTGSERFVAIENFFYTCEFFGGLAHRRPWDTVHSGGEDFCRMDWADIPGRFHRETEADLSRYCFNSAYSNRMLRDGFGLDPSSAKIEVVRRINGTAIDWALGAALVEVTRETPTPDDDLQIHAHPQREEYMDVEHAINTGQLVRSSRVDVPLILMQSVVVLVVVGLLCAAVFYKRILSARERGRLSRAGHKM